MTTDKEIIKNYESELKRLRIKNLRLKLHMEVLVSHPQIKTSADIRDKYRGKSLFSESILHYN